jgi:hypothetical protein
MVLAGAVDDQLLLAIDNLEIAVVVGDRDVARVQPSVRVDRLGRTLRIVAIALGDVRPANQDLAVRRELYLDARDRDSDRSELDGGGRI